MSREFLFLVQESAYKTPVATPVVGRLLANAFYIRLDGANVFTMRPRPVMVAVPYGGGVAIDAFRVSDKIECKGRLVTKLYAGPLSQFLLQWGGQQINTARPPWTTTEPAGDLASVSSITRSRGPTARSSGASTWAARLTAGTSTSARTARSPRSRWTLRRARRRATSSTARPTRPRPHSRPRPTPKCPRE